jgi:putative tryptophan/tyrosine transport system substrate-binding protein
MRRREFILLVGGGALGSTIAARAQQPAAPVIGFLHSESPGATSDLLRAFRQGLDQSGYVEGKTVTIDYRFAESQYDRLPVLAADLVRQRVNVIVANGPAVSAAKAATRTIPIVFFTGGDPVKLGLAASLSRPGGNLTGVTNLGADLGPKRLELLHDLVPAASTVGVLVNPTSPDADNLAKAVQAAAADLALHLHVIAASAEPDLERAFASLVERRASGLVIVTDPFFNSRQEQLAELTLRHAIPSVYHNREFVAAGGLAGYGNSSTDLWHKIGVSTGLILKGEKAAHLPIQQPTKFELIINLKTAKVLGLSVPSVLLASADEMIE